MLTSMPRPRTSNQQGTPFSAAIGIDVCAISLKSRSVVSALNLNVSSFAK
ncbi:hypothetical protein M7I_3227 [Glarea lozoyensis 74030]|uniref:Uncharacterized protein n=1 Tax=Glarea lozoyensis (strain ATCC 74030 / MF5533) TaxID=1104152 RepID=H0EKZ3_GLAL7|nr:hypothetical protein M7I_3227 [Glarea lozoyensis 74030]